jgi:hypothetical protein
MNCIKMIKRLVRLKYTVNKYIWQTYDLPVSTEADRESTIRCIAKINTINDKFIVNVKYIQSTSVPRLLVRRLGLHFMRHLLEDIRVLREGEFQ